MTPEHTPQLVHDAAIYMKLPQDLKDEFARVCKARNTTVSETMRALMQAYITRFGGTQ